MANIKAILTDSGNGWSVSTTILFPGDEKFAEATARWAIFKPPTYTACICPGIEEDVVKAVRCSNRVPISHTFLYFISFHLVERLG